MQLAGAGEAAAPSPAHRHPELKQGCCSAFQLGDSDPPGGGRAGATVGPSLGAPLDPNPRSLLETLTPQPHRMRSVGVRKQLAVVSACSGPQFPYLEYLGGGRGVLVSSQTPDEGK